jgi:hypothetical protein
MDLLKNMDGALKYIEDNLTNDIDLELLCQWTKEICLYRLHFHMKHDVDYPEY